jgi:alkylhydroperoxidase/carboxymuconolactone decarboxylase family protein YurZ
VDVQNIVSDSFLAFAREAGEQQQIWMEAVMKLGAACSLEEKTAELAYIAVLSALRMDSGLPFHVDRAKKLGASRKEVISAVLVGLPATGNVVVGALPTAVRAYDAD